MYIQVFFVFYVESTFYLKINDKKKAILGKKPIQWDNSKKDQGGIKILEINDFKSIIVHVRLHAEQFYKFDCKYDSYTIGLEPQTMFNFIKNIDKDKWNILNEKDKSDMIRILEFLT